MRKLASFLMVTLDGYYEGDEPWAIEWHNVDEEFEEFAVKQLDASDILIFGRATYIGMAQYWPTEEAAKSDSKVASRMNSMPKIVVSRTLDQPVPAWSNTHLVKDVNQLRELKSESGKDILVLGSSVLTTSLIEQELLDELRIIVNPLLLGKGRALSSNAAQRMPLRLLDVRRFDNGNVLLTYEPEKS
ncbi:MAG TPA: dihydrofolate reductase family protein [Candidatus Dormibacteraeota bacterium]